MCWNADDTRLITAGMDGAVYEWRVRDAKRDNEVIVKSCNYTCVTLHPDGRYVYAVGSDNKLKELSESQITRDWDSTVTLRQLVMSRSGKVLLAGTAQGTVRFDGWMGGGNVLARL